MDKRGARRCRELKFSVPLFQDDGREKHLRALRKWIRMDEQRLHVLLKMGRGKQEAPRSKPISATV